MRCAWQAYLRLLPVWMRDAVDELGRETLLELRLRIQLPPELILRDKSIWLQREVSIEDLRYVVNAASQYSPWAATTAAKGYLTAKGGHRIGICGEAVMQDFLMTGIRSPTSLCLRVARDFPGIAQDALRYTGSVLIIGKPGSGKTTLLRDLIRQRSEQGTESIAVVDERGELFPFANGECCYSHGRHTDILSMCGKQQGIDALLRTMSPSCIAVDEITEESDCRALLQAGWSGVSLLATAHAANRSDLQHRPVYRPIIDAALFDTLLVMQKDKSWRAERMI